MYKKRLTIISAIISVLFLAVVVFTSQTGSENYGISEISDEAVPEARHAFESDNPNDVIVYKTEAVDVSDNDAAETEQALTETENRKEASLSENEEVSEEVSGEESEGLSDEVSTLQENPLPEEPVAGEESDASLESDKAVSNSTSNVKQEIIAKEAAKREFDVVIIVNSHYYGTISGQYKITLSHIKEGTPISSTGSTLVIGNSVLKASPNVPSEAEYYIFDSFDGIPDNGEVNGNIRIAVNFVPMKRANFILSYNVSFLDGEKEVFPSDESGFSKVPAPEQFLTYDVVDLIKPEDMVSTVSSVSENDYFEDSVSGENIYEGEWVFDGWYYGNEYLPTQKIENNSIIMTQDTDVYGRWLFHGSKNS